MQAKANTYIIYIDLVQLENWSVQGLLDSKFSYSNKFELARIRDFLIRSRNVVNIENDKEYNRVTVKINNNGVKLRDTETGVNIGIKKQYQANAGQFIFSKIDARNGAFGIIPNELDKAIVTNDFPLFDVNTKMINPQFFLLITTTKEFIKFAQSCSSGTTNRQRMDIDMFLNQKIPLPKLVEQNNIVNNYISKINDSVKLEQQSNDLDGEIENYLYESLGLSKLDVKHKKNTNLQFINFENILEWGLDKILSISNKNSSKYSLTSIEENPQLAINLFRGKSPKYKDGTSSFILNQKCNRWNEIDLSFVKSVDEEWLKFIDINYLTKEGDILINSTGEGTIGRASYIKKEFEGLLYDSHLLLLRLDSKKINPALFVEVFNSKYGQDQVNKIKSAQATKQTELGTSNLVKIKFPLPDNIIIQNKIISKIQELRSLKLEYLNKTINLKAKAEQEFENAIFNR
jgi:restriction endonuclease S subunit